MKQLLTTLALIAGLLLGGATLAPAATAADGVGCGGVAGPPCVPATPAQPCGGVTGPVCPADPGCGVSAGPCAAATVEATANDYRIVQLEGQVSQLTAKVARVQRLADRRAATIQRLRAKVRSLR